MDRGGRRPPCRAPGRVPNTPPRGPRVVGPRGGVSGMCWGFAWAGGPEAGGGGQLRSAASEPEDLIRRLVERRNAQMTTTATRAISGKPITVSAIASQAVESAR
jgi:hypothetical protein